MDVSQAPLNSLSLRFVKGFEHAFLVDSCVAFISFLYMYVLDFKDPSWKCLFSLRSTGLIPSLIHAPDGQ